VKTNDTLVKDHDDDGPIRFMTPEEVFERAELNVKNTTESLRKRVLQELAKSNGHSNQRR
jgi:hypothetical protein